MLFNTGEFAVFLAVVWTAFWLLPPPGRRWLLLGASYVFYGAWDWRFLGLLWMTTAFDFWVGRALSDTEAGSRRRLLLVASIVANLAVLGFFKYWSFIVGSLNAVTAEVGLAYALPFVQVALPVGISFYTFQSMSYTIDVYRRRLPAERSLPQFALFVAFFPHLVAGPIVRPAVLMPQLARLTKRFPPPHWRDGLSLIGIGLFRKVVLADGVAPLVTEVFSDPSRHGSVNLAVGAIAFSIQIYGDFAGYTDMARGVARLFDVELTQNFNRPYMATSVTDFWRRWHISLSTWLRDYLYIPLGGNKKGRVLTYRNLMLTMVLGGLWHGAAWTFVVWGLAHGLYLSIDRLRRGRQVATAQLTRLSRVLTFALVTITWIPFRSPSLAATGTYLSRLITLRPGPVDLRGVLWLCLAVLGTWFLDRERQIVLSPQRVASLRDLTRGFGFGLAAVAALVASSSQDIPFIYFQF